MPESEEEINVELHPGQVVAPSNPDLSVQSPASQAPDPELATLQPQVNTSSEIEMPSQVQAPAEDQQYAMPEQVSETQLEAQTQDSAVPGSFIEEPTSQQDGFTYNDNNEDFDEQSAFDPNDSVSWASQSGSLYKKGGWQPALLLASVAIGVVLYLLFKDIISGAVIFFCALVFIVYARKETKEITYNLDAQEISVGAKHYLLSKFKSFSINEDNTSVYITFIPHKRFSGFLNISVPTDTADHVVDIISSVLPVEDEKSDPLDWITKRIQL